MISQYYSKNRVKTTELNQTLTCHTDNKKEYFESASETFKKSSYKCFTFARLYILNWYTWKNHQYFAK